MPDLEAISMVKLILSSLAKPFTFILKVLLHDYLAQE
jgi:hypothetical protein